jgi:hypothetical protein
MGRKLLRKQLVAPRPQNWDTYRKYLIRENVTEESQTKKTAHKFQEENGEVFFIEF